MFNVSELEGQVSHAYGLKQGRSIDERWGIPKRKETQMYTHPNKENPILQFGKGRLFWHKEKYTNN